MKLLTISIINQLNMALVIIASILRWKLTFLGLRREQMGSIYHH
ncbi:hypothetical protein SLEP1_g32096 [Rubroshorea leprosula]|uniref:Uncharacterized protein n=1 Tax=Rubroshorea leprosula TaxID=152421 RepID=A0AAV5KC78_9ROSI|nr:hypothetical protein SLEP1_g32096 [Rubroshorea leprosula]